MFVQCFKEKKDVIIVFRSYVVEISVTFLFFINSGRTILITYALIFFHTVAVLARANITVGPRAHWCQAHSYTSMSNRGRPKHRGEPWQQSWRYIDKKGEGSYSSFSPETSYDPNTESQELDGREASTKRKKMKTWAPKNKPWADDFAYLREDDTGSEESESKRRSKSSGTASTASATERRTHCPARRAYCFSLR